MIGPGEYSRILSLADGKGFLNNADLVVFIDKACLREKVQKMRSAFPVDAMHAIAIKSNPLIYSLKYFKKLGTSVEAASMGEVCLAKTAGFENENIVFDSPAKTKREIDELERDFKGMRVNADSLQELERYSRNSDLKIGLRINPQGGVQGGINYMNVSGGKSKFGEPIENRAAIIQSLVRNPNVSMLHLHQGSQVNQFSKMTDSIKRVIELAKEVNSQSRGKKIDTVDIGGGFPVNYTGEKEYEISDYGKALLSEIPELNEGAFKLITEFGRYVNAHAGWVASKVEYVKSHGNTRTAIIHAGADIFLRESYNPGDWPHKIFAFDKDFNFKDGEGQRINHDLGGPLCFGGDYVAKEVPLPELEEGDWIVVGDAGANSFALWSRHCSRQFPHVIGYDPETDEMEIAKKKETYEEIVRFWS